MNSRDAHAELGYFGGGTQRLSAKLQRLALAVSFAVHMLFIGYLQWHEPPAPPPPPPFVKLVDPPPFRSETAQAVPEDSAKKSVQEPGAVPDTLTEEKVPHSIETPDESKADMTLAVLKYDDPNHELPQILKRYRGYIGFGLSSELGEYVRHTFSAVTRIEATQPGAILSIEAFSYTIRVDGDGYALVDELRRKNKLEDYVAYALFSTVFADEVKHTLRKAVLARYGGGIIASATLILSADIENGLKVGDIVMANGSH